MKYLLIGLLLINSAHAQQKDDNTIIAHNVKFNDAVNRLLDLGYRIDKIDKDFHTASTDPVTGTYDMIIYIRVKDNGDLILQSDIVSTVRIPLVFGDNKKRWAALMEIAEPFGVVEYRKVNN